MHPRTKQDYQDLSDQYFNHIKGEYHLQKKEVKAAKDDRQEAIKIWDRDAEPALLTGLALYLGFNSLQEFEAYGQHGKFSSIIKRSRLRVEAEYEKKLHMQSPAGAIFALKSMGWADKASQPLTGEELPASLRIEIIESGPKPASNEKEVEINL